MEQIDQYKSVMTDIIAKQSIILGPEMSLLRAKKVSGISFSSDGKVTDIQGDPADALKRLIDSYVELSGQIVRNALSSIFTKYPEIKAQ